MDPIYKDSPVVYGPVFVSLSSWIASIANGNLVIAVILFRAFSIAGLVVTGFAVFDLAKRFGKDKIDALILTLANPIVLLHLVSGAHNESIMLAFLVSGVAVAQRPKFRPIGIALCAFAAAIKLPAILAVGFLGWSWGRSDETMIRRLLKLAFAGAEALFVIALVGQLTGWGWGWVDALIAAKPVDAYLSITRILGGAFAYLTGFDLPGVLEIARLMGLILAVGSTLLLLFRKHSSWPVALAWSLLLLAFLHPTTQPWYLTWGIMLYAACSAGERNRGVVALCAVAAFLVMPIGPDLGVLVVDSKSSSIILGFAILFVMTFSPKGHVSSKFRWGLDSSIVTVIVPTKNETENVSQLVNQLDKSRNGRNLEILFADDSDDDTPRKIHEQIVESREIDGLIVRILHRESEKRWGGLSGAVVDALGIAKGSKVVIMDGDLQHPVETVWSLADSVGSGKAVCVASRRINGGTNDGLTPLRRLLSTVGASVARVMFPKQIGQISDPMSGFFALQLSEIDLDRLQPDGFKILVEILGTHPGLGVVEVPYKFSGRTQGMSKASTTEGIRFASHLIDLRIRTSKIWSGATTPQKVFIPSRQI